MWLRFFVKHFTIDLNTFFKTLLCIIPCTTGIVHKHTHQYATYGSTGKKTTKRFGANQVHFALEACIDLLAKKAGLDRWEIRWRNALRVGDTFTTGQVPKLSSAAIRTLDQSQLQSLAYETVQAMAVGGAGVGLLRSEFLYLGRNHAPSHDEQVATYSAIARCVGPAHNLVVRTLDVGGDKPLPYWPIAKEENPFLGVRGIRLTLQRPQIMEAQLRALLRSADNRPLRIMFPMVGSVEEWRQARDMTERLRLEIPVADLQLGIMIEVPSAALLAPVLAKEVDFFSVGTNDLTQYTLAIDRGHPTLSAQADGLHPAVLQLIDITVRAAHAHGKWVGVCGELAADPLAVPVLVGLGVDELSVGARSIGEVKARVRELSLPQAQELARQALAVGSAQEVRTLVETQ